MRKRERSCWLMMDLFVRTERSLLDWKIRIAARESVASSSSGQGDAIKLAPSTPSPKKKKMMKTRKFVFVDLEGSSIEFKLVDGKMQEWCDNEIVLEDVKAITLNVNATIFDGIEMCPLLREDVIKASCWFDRPNMSVRI